MKIASDSLAKIKARVIFVTISYSVLQSASVLYAACDIKGPKMKRENSPL
jgi:hypothetical protein